MKKMTRFLSFFLGMVLMLQPPMTAFAQIQAPLGRVPTQVGQDPSSSFRSPANRNQLGQEAAQDQLMQLQMGQGMTGALAGASAAGYQVHVLGEVQKPGTYRVMASERLSEALQTAGGVNANGSERFIEVRRKDGGTKTYDLLKFKQHGDLSQNPYLTDNDVVFVPLKKKVVQVSGSVRRPNVYELNGEANLAHVVMLAGGFNSGTATDEPIRVIRFANGKKEVTMVNIADAEMAGFGIMGGDVIVVPGKLTKGTEFDYNVAAIPGDEVFYPSYEDRVFVLGGVSMPGAYPFSPYYSVNQYISLAGGLNDRGKEKYTIISIDGKKRTADGGSRVNPGDTLMIKQRIMSPAGWAGFALALASFGLSASATVLAITK